MRSIEELYKFHVSNLRHVRQALDVVATNLRLAIAKNNSNGVITFTRFFHLMLGIWAEAECNKLLHDRGGLDNSARQQIINSQTQFERWTKLVEFAFRNHYSVPRATLNTTSLSHTAFYRFSSLQHLLKNELKSVIITRNKLAHGQWKYPLNSEQSDIAQAEMVILETENGFSLTIKRGIIKNLLEIIHDLTVSKHTHERDFDQKFKRLEQARIRLSSQTYEKYKENLKAKYLRGRTPQDLV